MGEPYTCPYCHRPTTLSDDDIRKFNPPIIKGIYEGDKLDSVNVISKRCPNTECHMCSLSINLYQGYIQHGGKLVKEIPILPAENVPACPRGVPDDIYQLYKEACLVKKYSPAASAAIARTCLDKMLRDYWPKKIKSDNQEAEHAKALAVLEDSRSTLNQIIKALYNENDDKNKDIIKKREFIILDSCRKIGNSAAHWGEQSGVIFWDEKSQQYSELINGVIFTLFKNWYLKDHEEDESFGKIQKLADTLDAPHNKKAGDSSGTSTK